MKLFGKPVVFTEGLVPGAITIGSLDQYIISAPAKITCPKCLQMIALLKEMKDEEFAGCFKCGRVFINEGDMITSTSFNPAPPPSVKKGR